LRWWDFSRTALPLERRHGEQSWVEQMVCPGKMV
jgi:hypothetical protein